MNERLSYNITDCLTHSYWRIYLPSSNSFVNCCILVWSFAALTCNLSISSSNFGLKGKVEDK